MKKKGFTLIELLAVIIILAVIALIATPIVLNVIDDARESGRQLSVIGYADAIRFKVLEDKYYLEDKPFELSQEYLNGIVHQGDKVTCDIVTYGDNDVELYSCKVKDVGYYNLINGKVCKVGKTCSDDGSYQLAGHITYLKGKGELAYPDDVVPQIDIYKGDELIKTEKAAVNGDYVIDDLPVGRYTIRYTMLDHTSYTYKNYTILANESDLNVTLFKGDLNDDGVIDERDYNYFNSLTYVDKSIELRRKMDLNQDTYINMNDGNIIVANYGISDVITSKNTITISGTLTNGVKPRDNETITLIQGNQKYDATTDANGHYTFKNIPGGTYLLRRQEVGRYFNLYIDKDETIDIVDYTGTMAMVTNSFIQSVSNAMSSGKYNARFDVNKDNAITLEDYNFFQTVYGRKKHVLLNDNDFGTSKTITIHTTRPNTVVTLERSDAHTYFVTTDASGNATISLPNTVYTVYSYQDYYASKPVTIDTNSTNTVTINQIYGDLNRDSFIDEEDYNVFTNGSLDTEDLNVYDINQDGTVDDADDTVLQDLIKEFR